MTQIPKSESKKFLILCAFKVDSGMGLPMVNVLESTPEWTKGEVIVSSGRGSHTPCFSLDSASAMYSQKRGREAALCLPPHQHFISHGGYFGGRRKHYFFLGVSFVIETFTVFPLRIYILLQRMHTRNTTHGVSKRT